MTDLGCGALATQEAGSYPTALNRPPGAVGKGCGWGWGQADQTGQDRRRRWPVGRESKEGGGGAQMGSRWGLGGRQETDQAWTGRKWRTR